MNKSQLLQYLHKCLATGRPRYSGDGFADLAQALSLRMLATRGLDAKLSAADRVALERQWGQTELADRIIHMLEESKRHPPGVETFVDQSIEASLSVGNEPTGEDAEQAARARLLAEASLAFQSARELSIADIGVGQIIAEIANGQGLPETSGWSEPLDRWLERTIKYLRDYSPYVAEEDEPFGDVLSSLHEDPPTLLAEWIRRSRAPKGSTQPDHEVLERHIDALRDVLETLPERVAAIKSKTIEAGDVVAERGAALLAYAKRQLAEAFRVRTLSMTEDVTLDHPANPIEASHAKVLREVPLLQGAESSPRQNTRRMPPETHYEVDGFGP